MTDPFADLERELLAAHARRARPRLSLPPVRVLAMAAAAAAVVAAVALVGAQSDPERVVAPTPQPATSQETDAECGEVYRPAETDQAMPPEVGGEMGVFREERPPRVIELDTRMISGQATRIYRGTLRILPRTAGYDVFAVVADIVPRKQVIRPRDACTPPQGTTEPGACMVISEPKGSMAACFTLDEINGGEAFLDTNGRVIGFAPDGARVALAGDARTSVERNLFDLPGGPQTKVDFEP